MIERRIVQVQGIVQSVGFRPFVYALALRCDLKGHVFNNERGVLIELQGESGNIENFLQQLQTNPPSLAQVLQ